MRAAVLVFPGINRERDMARALRLICGRSPDMVWHSETALPQGTDLVVIPGGFSYGDYLRCGAIAARAPVMEAVRAHAAKGGLVLGVCNGFQILCEAGLLPGALMRNAVMKFICHDVYLRVERSDTPFTRGYNAGQVIRVPTAHGEGNYVADRETIDRLEGGGQGAASLHRPRWIPRSRAWNFNGATNAIAGLVNDSDNVLGIMPHPGEPRRGGARAHRRPRPVRRTRRPFCGSCIEAETAQHRCPPASKPSRKAAKAPRRSDHALPKKKVTAKQRKPKPNRRPRGSPLSLP